MIGPNFGFSWAFLQLGFSRTPQLQRLAFFMLQLPSVQFCPWKERASLPMIPGAFLAQTHLPLTKVPVIGMSWIKSSVAPPCLRLCAVNTRRKTGPAEKPASNSQDQMFQPNCPLACFVEFEPFNDLNNSCLEQHRHRPSENITLPVFAKPPIKGARALWCVPAPPMSTP